MEAMRFNDRQELIDKIKLWKKNYERVCCERDEVEDYYKDLVERKEKQLQNMLAENDEQREKTDKVEMAGEEALKALDLKWKKEMIAWNAAKEDMEQQQRDTNVELDKAKMQHDRALVLNERPKEDPQVAKLKARVKELEANIVQVESGVAALIEENATLSVATVDVEEQMEDVAAIYRPQLEAKDKEMKRMEIAHEELKEILKLEMQRAQDTCRDIEEQVKRFPDPFIDEIAEMKDKYNQMQAGMMKIQVENLHLCESNEKAQKGMEKEVRDLEKSLSLAKHLLHEVTTLEALKHLSTSEAREADDLGLF